MPETMDKQTPVYSIGTVARMLEVSVETLRLYERKGLSLVYKNDSNQRLYSEADIDRLCCIRSAIRDQKISIEGLRRLHSMVPCWKYVNCPPEQRSVCPAFLSPKAGCWTYRHQENVCAERECRTCIVYQASATCEDLKRLVHQHPAAALSGSAQDHSDA
jgi:MerR family transcriptional regulator/heat shock protein HspR